MSWIVLPDVDIEMELRGARGNVLPQSPDEGDQERSSLQLRPALKELRTGESLMTAVCPPQLPVAQTQVLP